MRILQTTAFLEQNAATALLLLKNKHPNHVIACSQSFISLWIELWSGILISVMFLNPKDESIHSSKKYVG